MYKFNSTNLEKDVVKTIESNNDTNLTKLSKDIVNTSYNTMLVLFGLSLIAAMTFIINQKLIPFIVTYITLPKFFKFRDLGLACGLLLASLYDYGAYKIVIVIFHDFDKNGNPTKYTITNQIAINISAVLPKHELIKNIPFSYILPEVEHMRANKGEHYCNVNDAHLSERFRRFMKRYSITSHYSYLMHDLQGNEVGCIYVDCSKELDANIYKTNLKNAVESLEAKITSVL